MDNTEYTRIFDKYAASVFRIACSYCKSQCDAEDVLQNVFIKLLKYDNKFNDEEHLRKWLIRVAVNESKNACGSFWKKRIVPLDELDPNRSEEFFNQQNSRLFEAVHKLKEKNRIVVHLYYYEDYSVREIAEILKIKESAVQTRLMRARNKLKEMLKEEWIDE